jgi:rubrerythrin
LSEVSNTLLYKSIATKFESTDLKRIFSNIQRDESRHLLAWKELIKDLIGSDEYHKKKVLEALEDGLHKNNAMLGRNYFKGVSDTMSIFPKGSLDTMANIKFNILEYWFGEDNPITKRDIKLGYAKFLQNNRGTS